MIGVVPSAFQRGEAERLLPVAPALGEGPERAQGPRQPRPGPDPHVCPGRARLPVRRLHAPPQQLGRPAEVADGIVGLPQVIGGFAPARRCRRARPRDRGPAGPPPWRRRGRPSSCSTWAILASTRPSRARSSSARPGPRPRPTGRGAAHTLPVALSARPNARRRSMASPLVSRARAGARGPGGPARRRPPPRGTRRGRRPWRRPAGSRSRPCPTPRPAGHGAPGVRPARPPGRGASASRASTMRACSTRRRSCSRLP